MSPDEHPPDTQRRGPLGLEISNEIVQLMRQQGGKGPTKCKTYFDGDLLIVLMRGGFTAAEQTMFAAGKWLSVREARHAFQDSIEVQLTAVIERVTGRRVLAFMSSSHQQPDLTLEAFLLDAPITPADPEQPDATQ